MNIKDELLDGINGVIFDMDGTLIDSMYVWVEIDKEFMQTHQCTPPDDMEKAIEGRSIRETAVYFKETFNLTESVDAIIESWHAMAFDKYSHDVCIKSGVREFLDYLKSQKIKLGIATSNSKELADACLENLGIKDYFDTIVTGNDITHGKPDPEIYITAADEMDVFPSKCCIFEDVVMGISAGIAAGMRTCAVYDKWSEKYDDEKRELADYYINCFNELI